MIQIVEKQVISKISKIHNLKDMEYIKGELYSVFSILILSEESFSKNNDIKEFLEKFDIKFKEYVYASRTNILGRVLREIQKADETRIKKFESILFKEINNDNSDSKEKKKQNKEENYLLGILDRYTRNGKK